MTNIYTDNPNQSSADATLEYFNDYNTKKVEFKPSDVSAMKGFFMERGMEELAADSTAFIVLRQCKYESLNPLEILDQFKQVEGLDLSTILGDILNLNRQVTSTLGTVNKNKKKDSIKRNIIA